MSLVEGPLNVDRIVDETLDALNGYTRHQEQVTALTSSLNTTATSFTVAEGQQMGRGLVEIGNEQILIKSVDANGAATTQPFGRGANNTTAAAHNPGEKVIMAPLYPRRRVRDAVFGTLREIFPSVFPVAEQLLDTTVVRTNYPLPSDTHGVLSVSWKIPGPSQQWVPLQRWRFNPTTSTPEIELLGQFFPGQGRARVLYIKGLPTDLTDENITTLGFSQYTHDLLVLGATSRLLMFSEAGRLQTGSVVAHGRSEVVPAGQLKGLATDLYSLFQRRVQQEADRLLQRYATTPHFNR